MSEKYRFKYNPSIWGFKRPESFNCDILDNPFHDMWDEALRPILSQIDPFKQYTIELVGDGMLTIKLRKYV